MSIGRATTTCVCRFAEQRDAQTVGFRGNRLYNAKGRGRRFRRPAVFPLDDAGRHCGPRQLARRDPQLSPPQRRRPTARIRKGRSTSSKNDDIRSKVRQGLFPAAVADLKKLGVAAEILQGTVPLNKPDVQGVMMGTASFDWKASGSTILPGAICEHFTSFGGMMTTATPAKRRSPSSSATARRERAAPSSNPGPSPSSFPRR